MAIRIPPKTDQDAKDTTAAVLAGSAAAGPNTPGQVKQGVAVPDAAEGTEVTTINALLASLRDAGVIAVEE